MKFLALLAGALLSAFASAQEPPVASLDAMRKLTFIAGEWRGKSTITTGPEGKKTSDVVEIAEFRLDGLLFTFEGRGVADGKVVHNAFGVISYDPVGKKYQMKAYTATGYSTDATISVSENQLVWGFEIPGAGTVRYTIKVKDKKWHEVGEITRDSGKTYFPFFEMNLDKDPDK